MRFETEYKLYQKMIGRSITPRTWDRIILDLGLTDYPRFSDRMVRLKALSRLRKMNRRVSVKGAGVDRAIVFDHLKSVPEGLTGLQVHGIVNKVHQISERQFGRWLDDIAGFNGDEGLRFGRDRTYTGVQLRQILSAVLIRVCSGKQWPGSCSIHKMFGEFL